MQSVEKTSWLLLLLPFLFLLTLVKDISQFAIFRLSVTQTAQFVHPFKMFTSQPLRSTFQHFCLHCCLLV